jgi:signal transduction histidine kinase
VLAITYAVVAAVAIEVPLGEGIVSPIWAPAGIAVAGIFLLGVRAWPAVFVAELVAVAATGTPVWVAAGLGAGNAAAAVLGAWSLRHYDLHDEFDQSRDVLTLAAAALGASVVSATNGVLLLAAAGEISVGRLLGQWALWWSGDVMGIFVVAPIVLTFAAHVRRGKRASLGRLLEFLAATALLAAAAALVFLDDEWRRPGLLLPGWTWLTLRFRAFGASFGTLVIAVFGVAGTLYGTEAIDGISLTASVQALNGLVLVAGVSLLAIAATIAERDAARTRLELALQAEQQVARELRRLDELKDRLLAAVSHELRTPLTSILALATLLADNADRMTASKRVEMHETIAKEVRRLDALLTDLLDVERVRMGLLDADRRDVDVAELVQAVVDRHVADDRPTRVDLEPVHARVDPTMVDRIVDNLVTNAHRHTPSSTPLTVRVRPADGGVLISVDDEGTGVADPEKAAIFEPFHRGDAAVTDAPGTGIGLSLVLQFAQLHGGRAWVEDRPGGGASFRVFLPG